MCNTSIRIRLATLSDLPDVELCARAAYSKYIDRMGQEPAPMVANVADQIELGQVSVAFCGTTFVGYVVFYPERDHMHLESVAVVPSQCGQGVGRTLVEYVEQAARQAGLDAVELYTHETMTENLSMYPHFGYTETERKQQAGFKRVFFRKAVNVKAVQ